MATLTKTFVIQKWPVVTAFFDLVCIELVDQQKQLADRKFTTAHLFDILLENVKKHAPSDIVLTLDCHHVDLGLLPNDKYKNAC